MRIAHAVLSVFLYAASVSAQLPSPQLRSETDRVFTLDAITSKGSRLPERSIIRLSGLRKGQSVTEVQVRAACHKIAATGLVKAVDYQLTAYPDRPAVALVLTVEDELPLLPAQILPQAEAAAIWHYLSEVDPLFTRQMPRTEKAIDFYAKEIDRYLAAQHRSEYAAGAVTGDRQGNASVVVFSIRNYHVNPKLN